MRPLLVVEDEARIIGAAEHESAARNIRIAEPRVRSPGFSRNVRLRTVPAEAGTTNGERLPRISDRFAVHVFVEQREFEEIRFVAAAGVAQIAGALHRLFNHAVENSAHVGDRLPLRRQRQVPARVVGHAGRIIKLIWVEMWRGPYRFEAAQMAQEPELLEESHVRNLPTQRIYDGETRPNHLLVVQIGDEVEQARAGLLKMADQLRRSALRAG